MPASPSTGGSGPTPCSGKWLCIVPSGTLLLRASKGVELRGIEQLRTAESGAMIPQNSLWTTPCPNNHGEVTAIASGLGAGGSPRVTIQCYPNGNYPYSGAPKHLLPSLAGLQTNSTIQCTSMQQQASLGSVGLLPGKPSCMPAVRSPHSNVPQHMS